MADLRTFPPAGRRAVGFTLIEMIVALTTTGLILAAAYATLFSGLDSYRYSAYRGEVYSVLQRALDRMVDDLVSAHLSGSEGIFAIETDVIETERFGEIPLDRLRIQALVAKVAWNDRPQEDLAEIEYFIDNEEETPARWLVRRIQTPVDGNLSAGGNIHLVGPRIVGMEVRAHDGEQWVEEWNSSNAYPQRVSITLFMEPPRSSGITDRLISLSSVAWLPRSKGQAAPASEAEGGAAGETVAQGVTP